MQKEEERRNIFTTWKDRLFLTGEWKIQSTGGTYSYRFIIIISFTFYAAIFENISPEGPRELNAAPKY